MASVSLLVALAPGLLLGAVCLFRLGISRSGKKCPSLQRYEHTHAFAYDSSQAKPQVETSVTFGPVATTSGSCMPSPATSAEAILQFVLDALHHLTGLPLLMVNQPDHNLPSSIQTQMTQMRADQKNADLSSNSNKGFSERSESATWSEHEAPEEEMSDLSSDEEEQDLVKERVTSSSTAQNQLFDGLEFYLAVSQVRERTVRSVLALGMAKTLTTLRDRQQNESIAVIEQKYPDFTCLPKSTTATVQELRGSEQRPLDLLAALRLPSAAAVARSQSPMKGPVRARLTTDEEGRVRRPPLPSHGPNISRVA